VVVLKKNETKAAWNANTVRPKKGGSTLRRHVVTLNKQLEYRIRNTGPTNGTETNYCDRMEKLIATGTRKNEKEKARQVEES
jgi:hypothetical protein